MTGLSRLDIAAVGAVTPVGMDAAQTCAAIRAGISGIRQGMFRPPPNESMFIARVPARDHLRRTDRQWLCNLASRAIEEVLEQTDVPPDQLPLLLAIPEPFRRHPALTSDEARSLLVDVQLALNVVFHPASRILVEGHAAVLFALPLACELLATQRPGCLVCGVDSLLNASDIEGFASLGRLHGNGQPQGLIPGEGAACVLLTPPGRGPALAGILGHGSAHEAQTILGDDYSTGAALATAIGNAARQSSIQEPQIDYRISDMNGERYRGWESMLAATRFYRTHRERLPLQLPAASTGDIGAAAGALGLVVAAVAMSKSYAFGPIVCCEGSSSEGVRAAAIVAAGDVGKRSPS